MVEKMPKTGSAFIAQNVFHTDYAFRLTVCCSTENFFALKVTVCECTHGVKTEVFSRKLLGYDRCYYTSMDKLATDPLARDACLLVLGEYMSYGVVNYIDWTGPGTYVYTKKYSLFNDNIKVWRKLNETSPVDDTSEIIKLETINCASRLYSGTFIVVPRVSLDLTVNVYDLLALRNPEIVENIDMESLADFVAYNLDNAVTLAIENYIEQEHGDVSMRD